MKAVISIEACLNTVKQFRPTYSSLHVHFEKVSRNLFAEA